jgi:DNA-binding NarL/FixJ family response regulator
MRSNFFNWSEPVTPRTVLLFTCDSCFDELIAEVFSQPAIILSARTVREALQIVCQRGRELNLALMDFDGAYRGMTLLSAVHICYEQLPIVVTTSEDLEHACFLAYANGARTCLKKPLSAARFAQAIADVTGPSPQSVAAQLL